MFDVSFHLHTKYKGEFGRLGKYTTFKIWVLTKYEWAILTEIKTVIRNRELVLPLKRLSPKDVRL